MSDADREIVYTMKMEVDAGSEAEVSKFAELSERVKRMLENDIRSGISKGFEGGFSNGARGGNGSGAVRNGMAEAVKAAPKDMEQAGQTAGKLYVNGFRASLKRDIRTAINEAIREAAPPYRGSGAGFGGAPLPLIPNVTRQAAQGGRSRRSGRKIIGFAAGVGYGDETDQEQVKRAQAQIQYLKNMAALRQQVSEEGSKGQVDRAQRDIDRFQRQMEAAQQKEEDRDAAAKKRAADREAAADQKRHAANIAREEKYWADRRKVQERAQAASEKDEQRRFKAGNRQLSQFVKEGPKAVEQDRRRTERERLNAEREQKLAARRQREAQSRVEQGIYGTVHAFGQLTRAAAQFGLVGQRDMMKVLDTIFAIEGGINAVQGGMNAFRAIKGLREARAAAGTGGAVGGAVRAASAIPAAAGMGGTGTAAASAAGGAVAAGAPVAAIAAAAASVAAALGSAVYTIRAASQNGLGGGFAYGSYGQQYGDFVGGLGSRVAGWTLSAAGAAHETTAPLGLTSRQREMRTENALQGFANSPLASEFARSAMSNRRTERMSRWFEEERSRRDQMRDLREQIDATIVPIEARAREQRQGIAAERFGLRTAAMQRRGEIYHNRIGEAFGRQQTAYGEQLAARQRLALGQHVDRAAFGRATAEQAREEGLVTATEERQRNNLLTQKTAIGRRQREVGQELSAANQRFEAADSQVRRDVAAGERTQAEEKLKQLAQERAQIEDRIRQVGIDGARRRLALNEQSLATAKQTADTLRQQRQSATERFGHMLPGQQRSAIAAAQQLAAGKQLNRHQLAQLEPFQELFGPELREQWEKRAKAGGFEQLLANAKGFNQRTAAAEQQERQLGQVVVKGRQDVVLQIENNNDQVARDLVNLIMPLLERQQEQIKDEVKKAIQHSNDDLRRQQNSEARQLAR